MSGELSHPGERTAAALLTGVLRTIGSADFSEAFLHLVEAEFGGTEIGAYVLEPGKNGSRSPRPIFHASRLDDVPGRTEGYCDRFFAQDRIWPLLAEAASGETISLHQRMSDLGPCTYRTEFGMRAGFEDVLSVGFRYDRPTVLHLYYRHEAPMNPDAPQRFNAASVTLMSAILAHRERCNARSRAAGETKILPVRQVEWLLTKIRPDLPLRERQVCARTVVGMTALGIALDLGVSVATVTTYRRRAYNRMGICSAFELFAPLISSCDSMFWVERRDRAAA